MFRMYASNSHSYTHLILALGIVREPIVWVFITSKYPGIHAYLRARTMRKHQQARVPSRSLARPLLRASRSGAPSEKEDPRGHVQVIG